MAALPATQCSVRCSEDSERLQTRCLSVYEWKWFEFGPGALSRRIGIAFLAWVAANALCMIVTGPQSHLSVDVLGTVVVAGGFAVWLGLLVRLVAPGIFVAADRVKIRNSWWTHVLLSRDIAGFERGPSPRAPHPFADTQSGAGIRSLAQIGSRDRSSPTRSSTPWSRS
jgi:hypothetical protein